MRKVGVAYHKPKAKTQTPTPKTRKSYPIPPKNLTPQTQNHSDIRHPIPDSPLGECKGEGGKGTKTQMLGDPQDHVGLVV